MPAERFTYFSTLLSDAGYQNGYFGKWHVEQSGKLERFGWQEYDIRTGGVNRSPEPDSRVTVPTEGYSDYLLAGVDRDEGERNHPAFEQGIDFIRRSVGTGTPFCCVVSTSEPHDPYIPPKRFFEMYDLSAVQLTPTLHDEPTGKPELIRRMRAVWGSLTDDDWRRITAAYWATISFVDSQIGRIIDVLRETGQYDNTIIVFTSDHGDMLGAHGLATKGVGTSYEEVYNIPLVMRVPGMTGGYADRECVVSLVDLAPTLLDLCGVGPMPDTQGRSLRPILEKRHNPADWHEGYAEFFGQRFVYTQRIVWHENWKYVFSPGGIDELYDLGGDPHETRNLAGDPGCRDILRGMCRRMWKKMKDIGDTSLLNTQYATLRTAPIGPLSISEPS